MLQHNISAKIKDHAKNTTCSLKYTHTCSLASGVGGENGGDLGDFGEMGGLTEYSYSGSNSGGLIGGGGGVTALNRYKCNKP